MDIHLDGGPGNYSVNINGQPYTHTKSLEIRMEPRPQSAMVLMVSYLDQDFTLSGPFMAQLGLPGNCKHDITLHISPEGYGRMTIEGRDDYFEVLRASIRASAGEITEVTMDGYWVTAEGDSHTSTRISGLMCDIWAGKEQT